MLDNRADFGRITLLYGARSPQDMSFKADLEEWRALAAASEDFEVVLTVDAAAEGWGGRPDERVGLIPHVLTDLNPAPGNAVAVICGPPIMIRFTLEALKKLGFADGDIVTTLEKRMKCGVGLCGRCNIGTKYVCVDGPVFTYAELKDLPNEL